MNSTQRFLLPQVITHRNEQNLTRNERAIDENGKNIISNM